MKRAKVLLVNKFYYPVTGGVENHVKTLAENIKDRFSTYVICCNKGRSTQIHKDRKCKNAVLYAFLSFAFLFWMRKIKADILHFHLSFPLSVISYFLATPEGKIVVT